MNPLQLLYLIALLGLVLAVVVFTRKTQPTRRRLAGINLALVNILALAVLAPAYLISRLDGSRPPGPGEFLAPYALGLLLILIADGLMIWAASRGQ